MSLIHPAFSSSPSSSSSSSSFTDVTISTLTDDPSSMVMANTTNFNNTTFDQCSSADESPYSIGVTVVIATVLAALSLATAGGNLLVLISFKIDPQLQTISNYFLLSLAVADFAIGIVSMPLYSMYILLNRWPLGPFVCDAWLSLDYTMSNASVANLLIISFDRFLSVTKPLTYRAHRTPAKAAAMIAAAWLVSAFLWTPWIFAWPYFEGQRTVPECLCYIQFFNNTYITIGTAVFAFYLPVSIMCVLYFLIFRETQKRRACLARISASRQIAGMGAGGGGGGGSKKEDDSSDGELSLPLSAKRLVPSQVTSTSPDLEQLQMMYESALQIQAGTSNSSSCWARCRTFLHLDSSSVELSKDQSSGSDLQATPVSLSPTSTVRDTLHANAPSRVGQTNPTDQFCRRSRAAKVSDVQRALLKHRDEGSADEEEEDEEEEEEEEDSEDSRIRFKVMAPRNQVVRSRENNLSQTSRSRLINQRTISEEREEGNDSETTMSSQQHIDNDELHYGSGGMVRSNHRIYSPMSDLDRRSEVLALLRHDPEVNSDRIPAKRKRPKSECRSGFDYSGSDVIIDERGRRLLETTKEHETIQPEVELANAVHFTKSSKTTSRVHLTKGDVSSSTPEVNHATPEVGRGVSPAKPEIGLEESDVIRAASEASLVKPEVDGAKPEVSRAAPETFPSIGSRLTLSTDALRVGMQARIATRVTERTKALKNQRKKQEKRQEQKAAKTLSAILLAFIVTWTPYNIFTVINAFCTDCVPSHLYAFGYWLCYINSTINPVCYALCNANFRQTYWRILKCQWRSRRQRQSRKNRLADCSPRHGIHMSSPRSGLLPLHKTPPRRNCPPAMLVRAEMLTNN